MPFGQELESETRSAILGGVTTIGTYFNQPGSYLPVIDRLRREVSQLSRVDMIPHFSLREQQQIDELPLYSRQGMNSFKVYMCGVPGPVPPPGGRLHHPADAAHEAAASHGPPHPQHPLRKHLHLRLCHGGYAVPAAGHSGRLEPHPPQPGRRARPSAGAAYFAREMGVRTYVVHSSTREALEALAADKHPNLYVETTSPYLCLDTDSPIRGLRQDAAAHP